jgi:hypothetical protein
VCTNDIKVVLVMTYSSTSSRTVGSQLDEDHPPTRVINGICHACRFEVTRTFDGVEVHAPAPGSVNRAMQFIARRPPLAAEDEVVYDIASALRPAGDAFISIPEMLEALKLRGSDLPVDLLKSVIDKEAHWGRMEWSEEPGAGFRVVSRSRTF